MKARVLALIFGSLLLLTTATAHAHKASDSYMQLTADGDDVRVDWRVGLRDLDALMDLDHNHDGKLSWGEVSDRQAVIAEALQGALTLTDGAGNACLLQLSDFGFAAYGDGGYVGLQWRVQCAHGQVRDIKSVLFQQIDPSHRVLLSLGAAPFALAPGELRQIDFSAVPVPLPATQVTMKTQHGASISEFIRGGIWHIFEGTDHILFLLALLLPSVLRWEKGRWRPETTLRSVLLGVGGTATAFTFSHSLSLAAAVYGLLEPPSRIIEPLVALTVIAAAVNNIRRLWALPPAVMAFSFGIIHGFAFADTLTPLHLAAGDLVGALFGFNVGVEIGQLTIIAGFCTLAFPLRQWRGYVPVMLRGGSLLTMLLGGIWLVERVLGLSIISGA